MIGIPETRKETNPIVEVLSVCKSYASSEVIRNCSFQIREGEIYGLLGVNGAGKTTLMKLILGLQKLNSGRITVLGQEVGAGWEYLSEVGSMIEVPVFYGHLNAEEILSMHLTLMGAKANIADTLKLVGLLGVGGKPVEKYSLGMRQRLGLARAIIHAPRLLILDEPLNGLDPLGIAQMRELLRELTAKGMSILLSSHIIGEIRHTADRIGILSGGEIVKEFSVREKAEECGEGFEDYVISIMGRKVYGSV
ncbi:MAG: ATP-binding cassette domain-containing protein [Lachnospiraceae bacterium]|nr:ATP-binding cassette domain-containing protein [Lachnospiraceae bacterium]